MTAYKCGRWTYDVDTDVPARITQWSAVNIDRDTLTPCRILFWYDPGGHKSQPRPDRQVDSSTWRFIHLDKAVLVPVSLINWYQLNPTFLGSNFRDTFQVLLICRVLPSGKQHLWDSANFCNHPLPSSSISNSLPQPSASPSPSFLNVCARPCQDQRPLAVEAKTSPVEQQHLNEFWR